MAKSDIEKRNDTHTTVTKPDQPITLHAKLDIQHMAEGGRQLQRMKGFDPKFTDIVDYIIRITHEIWEEKAVGKLYDYYANTIRLHTSDGGMYGREAVMAATLATLAAYPDRRLYGDEVIWGGDDVQGFYSSHRLVHTGTNRGWSLYGSPTGRKVEYYAIADCAVRDNMIYEEWLVRDELTLVHQLGLDPVETAKAMAKKEADMPESANVSAGVERGFGQMPPQPLPERSEQDFDPAYFVQQMIQDVWNRRMINDVRRYYAEDAYVEAPSQRKLHGHDSIQAYALGLLSPFPDLGIVVEHSCTVGDEQESYRVATRWRMRGTHTGYGVYGEPTGNPINILGISHHLIQGKKIIREWCLFDEFALLKQIHRP